MKLPFILLFLGFSITVTAQQHGKRNSETLIKINKVKKRHIYSTSKLGSGHSIEYFDRQGKIKKSESLSPLTGNLFMTTEYYYDSLNRLYASKMIPANSWQSSTLMTTYSLGGNNNITYYQYDSDNHLQRKYNMDISTKKLKYDCIYLPDSSMSDTKFYNEYGQLFKERFDYFEGEAYLYKSETKIYDSTGAVFSSEVTRYENTFNDSSQLIRSVYSGKDCNSIKNYEYYDNGLIKRVSGDDCSAEIKYKYKYY